MIIYFAPGGRLGNQLFGLCYLESIRQPRERILTTKLGPALASLSRMHRYMNTDRRFVVTLVDKVLAPFVLPLFARLRLISSRSEDGRASIMRTKGILPITYVRGYFQRASAAESFVTGFRLRKNHIQAAARILREAGNRTPLFVHVRRTDYANYFVEGQRDPTLPLSYYERAVSVLKSEVPNPFFFFVGDEPAFVSRSFPDLPGSRPRNSPAAVDLALMSLCAGGILSNSTFAWWGAYLCSAKAPLIAPMYWLGWKASTWYPSMIQTAKFRYLDVA